jgi:hypothetical protein
MATCVKNKTQCQSSFRWYKCNHITKKEQHTEAFYTSTERVGAYDGELIQEESLDEAFNQNDVVEEDSFDDSAADHDDFPLLSNLTLVRTLTRALNYDFTNEPHLG